MQKDKFGLTRPLDLFYMLGAPMAIFLTPFAYFVEVRHGFSSNFSNGQIFTLVVLQAGVPLLPRTPKSTYQPGCFV